MELKTAPTPEPAEKKTMSGNFIHDDIEEDLTEGRYNKVHTRFPPEPNGYLHIGHAKSICLNFGTAQKYGGVCNLRFDDTNPAKEDDEYIRSIKADVRWLGFDWGENLFYASDYFDKLYGYAVELIRAGKAYVCELSADQMREYRGSIGVPARSPWRDRPIEESLDLFERMKNGEFADGQYTLRAKIDLASPNFVLRDPVIYRIQHGVHHRTGDKWCIYPMYDFAHPLSDSLEGITHSICTMEFEIHRPLYEWLIANTSCPTKSRQIEFARLNLTHTVMSKRFLRKLVEEGYVTGWDDPRMPTLSGLRRRGYTPEAIRDFCERIGVAKAESMVDTALLEHCLREDLNTKADRVMCVLDPLKVIITNYPENEREMLPVDNNPEKPERGKRLLPFSREIYIEREDFMEEPPKKFFRLKPGGEVRLKGAYIIKCEEVVKDAAGNITELRCTYDPETKSGGASTKKVKATIHWVNAKECKDAEVRLYDYLFTAENPYDVPEGSDFIENLNPNSLEIKQAKIESLFPLPGEKFQFLRHGYFATDPDSTNDHLVFNRIVSLKSNYKG
ncbi:MAG TPA: glutamine--tRNA ligase/YqeY domain fusion protein [Candidatus Avidehalobacter gallistercoris]|uniref:Glutamine--tRNA ligase n=1 Tax=Candidatus Avidehalobacter gallistercoris TaxID=2840694 RepID=A0A9D1HK97_9FIRM|nr:glutamine--tRNA ligase/YqeY domain fusion protein [Candidatus Avidehalobacter gallistercoris]